MASNFLLNFSMPPAPLELSYLIDIEPLYLTNKILVLMVTRPYCPGGRAVLRTEKRRGLDGAPAFAEAGYGEGRATGAICRSIDDCGMKKAQKSAAFSLFETAALVGSAIKRYLPIILLKRIGIKHLQLNPAVLFPALGSCVVGLGHGGPVARSTQPARKLRRLGG